MFRSMGEVFVGPGFRICSRSGCKWPATASLSFNYSTRETWLEELKNPPELTHYDICNIHAGRFRPPHGWTLEDRRGMPIREARPTVVPPVHDDDTLDRWAGEIEPPDDPLDSSDEPAEALARPTFLDHSPDWRPQRIKPGGESRGPAASANEIVVSEIVALEGLDPPSSANVQAALTEP